MCVSFGSNDFVTKVQPFPMYGHCRIDIISGVGHPRLDLIMPLMLCMVAYNICGTGIVLQVSRDSIHLKSDLVVLLVLCTIAYNIQGTGVVLQVSRDSVNPVKKG
jgi:hypothetical protein